MKNSLSLRFNILTSLLVIVLLAVFGAYNQSETRTALNAALDKQTNAVMGRLVQSLPATLWNFETDQMISIVESEVSASEIRGVFVFDNKKLVLGRISDESGEVIDATLPDDLGTMKENPLKFDDSGVLNKVGRVIILVDESAIEALLNQALTRTFLQVIIMVVLLVATITILLRQIVIRPLADVADALNDISQGEGDLTRRLTARKQDEIGSVANHFNSFADKIQVLVQQVVGSMTSMSELIQELVEVAQKTSQGVQTQSSETEQVATAINQMSATAHEISQNAAGAAESAQHADEEAQDAKSVVAVTIDAIKKSAGEIENGAQVINALETDVGNITSMVGVIQGIAEQTNLLALNAAIEAARAGEQGRGFAVVADEVRQLASRTSQATVEIVEVVQKNQQLTRSTVTVIRQGQDKAQQGLELSNESGRVMTEIKRGAQQVVNAVSQFANQLK